MNETQIQHRTTEELIELHGQIQFIWDHTYQVDNLNEFEEIIRELTIRELNN